MKITILTLFPEMFEKVLHTSILGRAETKGLVEYQFVNIREFGEGVHQVVDDRPYGGGVGMVFRADILAKALHSVLSEKNSNTKVILLSASGKPLKENISLSLSKLGHLILICGHYEGVDQRFIDKYVDEEISIGDYVLTGGELPAMVVLDTVVRLIPGVLKKEEATQKESFSDGFLEHPQYTRPEEFEGKKVPQILLSGNHAEIEKWRREKSLEKTKKNRPDLLE